MAKEIESEDEIKKIGQETGAIKRLATSLGKIEYKDKDEATFEKGDLKVFLKYGPIPEYLLKVKPERIDDLSIEDEMVVDQMGQGRESFRLMAGFSLDNGKTSVDLFQFLPQGYDIYFSPIEGRTFAQPESQVLFLHGMRISPKVILSLFHEVGHAADYEKMSKEDRKKYIDARVRFHGAGEPINRLDDPNVYKPTPGDVDVVLKSERDAWAFTLRKLRPFFKDLGITHEDLAFFVHKYGLSSYVGKTKEIIEKGLLEEIKD